MKESIFSEKNKVKGNWMSWDKIGDKIEGTYVGMEVVKAKYPTAQNKGLQNVYELETSDGETWKVGGRYGLDMQMKKIKFGQIIGMEFVSEKENKGSFPTKIIQVYADRNIVNEEWLKEEEERKALEVEAGVSEDQENVPEDDGAVDTSVPPVGFDEEKTMDQVTEEAKKSEVDEDEIMAEISLLAQEKLGASEDAEDVKNKVMEKTGLAFVSFNLEKIVNALRELPAVVK